MKTGFLYFIQEIQNNKQKFVFLLASCVKFSFTWKGQHHVFELAKLWRCLF